MSQNSIAPFWPRRIITGGTLRESEQRLQAKPPLLRVGAPFAIKYRTSVGGAPLPVLVDEIREKGYGLSESAAGVLSHIEPETGTNKVAMAFAREPLRALGFAADTRHTTLLEWAGKRGHLVPPRAALSLLEPFERGEVADFARILMVPIAVGGVPYFLTVLGSGPMLYALPVTPSLMHSPDTEFIFRIDF